ncbi:MAG: histidinol phosphatase [Arachidicoccus sp.]|nr:histidinol phosphatase [Arachidicoccus sp.]
MFNFLKKKADKISNWDFIQTDIHSHIIPGIDDGAETIEDSIKLIKEMYHHGYKKMIATPHISEDIYPNSKETIFAKRDQLREKLAKLGINIKIDAAAEYMIDGNFVNLAKEEQLLPLFDNYVLVEMSYLVESPYLDIAIFALQTHGYKPILAHPERYSFYHNNLDKYNELKNKGCLFQLNTIAFSGYYGKSVKKTAEYLLGKNMYEFCGSDIHHLKHVNALHSVLSSKHTKQLEEYHFRNNEIDLAEQFDSSSVLAGDSFHN